MLHRHLILNEHFQFLEKIQIHILQEFKNIGQILEVYQEKQNAWSHKT